MTLCLSRVKGDFAENEYPSIWDLRTETGDNLFGNSVLPNIAEDDDVILVDGSSGSEDSEREEISSKFDNSLIPSVYSLAKNPREKSVKEDGIRKLDPVASSHILPLIGSSELPSSYWSHQYYFISPTEQTSSTPLHHTPQTTLKDDSSRINKKMRAAVSGSTDHLPIKQSQFNKNGKSTKELKEEVGESTKQEKGISSTLPSRFYDRKSRSHAITASRLATKENEDTYDNIIGTMNDTKGKEPPAMKVLSPSRRRKQPNSNYFVTFNSFPFNKRPIDLSKSLTLIKAHKNEPGMEGKQAKNQRKESIKKSINPYIGSTKEAATTMDSTNVQFKFPLRPPFPYVQRDHNEDTYTKTGRDPENTNEMATDPRQEMVNKNKLLLHRRNRSKRDAPNVDALNTEENESGENVEVAEASVTNSTRQSPPPVSNAIEALQKLTRLLERMLRELSQFQQKFTLRLIKMTEREDIDQMQEIMKDFEISSQKPIFFIAGGLKKLNFSIRAASKTKVSTGNEILANETEQTTFGVLPSEVLPPLTPNSLDAAIIPILIPTQVNDSLPVDSEEIENVTSTEVQGSAETDVEVTTNSPSQDGTDAVVISAETMALNRKKRAILDFDDFYVLPVPGRSARTENPYDDEDSWYESDAPKELKFSNESSEEDLDITPAHHLSHLIPSPIQINQSQAAPNAGIFLSNKSNVDIVESSLPIENTAAVPLSANIPAANVPDKDLINANTDEHHTEKSIDQIPIPLGTLAIKNSDNLTATVPATDKLNDFENKNVLKKIIDTNNKEESYLSPVRITKKVEFQDSLPKVESAPLNSVSSKTSKDSSGNIPTYNFSTREQENIVTGDLPLTPENETRPSVLNNVVPSQKQVIESPLPPDVSLTYNSNSPVTTTLLQQSQGESEIARPPLSAEIANIYPPHSLSTVTNPISENKVDKEEFEVINKTSKPSSHKNSLQEAEITPDIKEPILTPKAVNLLPQVKSKQDQGPIEKGLIADSSVGGHIDENILPINKISTISNSNSIHELLLNNNNVTHILLANTPTDEFAVEEKVPSVKVSPGMIDNRKENSTEVEDPTEKKNIMKEVSSSYEQHPNIEQEIAKVYPNQPTFHASTNPKESSGILGDNNATLLAADKANPNVISIHPNAPKPEIIRDETDGSVKNSESMPSIEEDISGESLANLKSSQKESVSLGDTNTGLNLSGAINREANTVSFSDNKKQLNESFIPASTILNLPSDVVGGTSGNNLILSDKAQNTLTEVFPSETPSAPTSLVTESNNDNYQDAEKEISSRQTAEFPKTETSDVMKISSNQSAKPVVSVSNPVITKTVTDRKPEENLEAPILSVNKNSIVPSTVFDKEQHTVPVSEESDKVEASASKISLPIANTESGSTSNSKDITSNTEAVSKLKVSAAVPEAIDLNEDLVGSPKTKTVQSLPVGVGGITVETGSENIPVENKPVTDGKVVFSNGASSVPVTAPVLAEEIVPAFPPETDLDSSFGVKPIDTVPNLQIPGFRPSIPARPQPDYIKFVAHGVDVNSMYFSPPTNPVILPSPPVFSSYSPSSIIQKQQQLMNNYFSGLLFRRDFR